ncbi:multidrug transporter [Pseudozyma hubeiensis SY62]|uniref:Multidrug transporter n=1 Tax=Pseudozyma hubeiensis (strain SY62) TaxID=1305764 RepID=R9PDK8_PSEHS|nr:multidrug transporter [Pseudozyma hubeiensis SY62]GAC99454.1 multidrug transporter [Pseudozyma hubeiensis SY62]
MREAEISAEDALRRYQAETQQAYATFPYQVHRKPVPQPAQRQSAATIGGPNQLQRIPEVPSEGSSGEAAAKSDSKPELTMPSSLRAGGPIQTVRHDRAASMEEYSRALPRNLDPVTGKRQAGKQGGRRPSLPYVFEPLTDPQSQRASFPNPHQSVAGPSDSQLSTTQLQRRASQQSQSPILSRNPSSFGPGQNEDRRRRNQDNPYEFGIPPTPPLGQPRTFQTVPLSIKKASTTQQAAAPSSAPQAGSSNSAWSSTTESEPTPTPSSIAATRERNAQLEAQLQPVQLTLPATFAHRSAISPQAATSSAIGARFGGDGAQGRPPVPADAVSAANVASIKASATPFAPTKSSNLSAPPIRSNSDDTTFSGEIIALPDGTQIPTVRTDFQNLKRISMPKPAAFEDPAGKQQTPTVAGHVIAREGAKKVPKNDGSSRTIYSPTPQTLAAARRQSSMLQVPQAGAQGGGTNDQRIPSPLSASAEAPAAPQIPQSLKFDRAVPSAGASTSYEPQNLPDPATAPRDVEKQGVMHRGDGIKSVPGRTRTKSDDTDIRTRADAEQLDFDEHSRRNTFGEPAPGMLEEANRKLYQYQMQQLGKEAKAKDVSTSRQPPSTDVGSVERVEKKSDQPIVATTSIVRRESTASQQSRRDSIGSATTAFDSPTKEEFPANLFRQSSQTGSAKAIRGTARETVAPPSDVQEVQEPEEIVASDDDDGTEIDDHDDAYDTSFETRMPFVVDTYTMNGPDYDDVGDKSEFRFIPISSVKAGKARRPRTRDTRVSFRSNPSHIEQQGPGSRQHGAAPACRQCFRAGFDCAMNLQLGEGTAARKAFQDFVAAGGLNAFSIRDGGAVGGGRPRTAGSLVDSNAGRITVEEALGRNYVDKLGEVAFGESALSRPVTRGMYNELLEEKQEQDRRKQLATNHKPWVGDVDEETEFTKDGGLQDAHQQRSSTDKVKRSLSNSHKDRRLSQMTLQDGVDNDQIEAHDGDARQVLLNNMKRSGSHKRGQLEEGEIVDYDPADYEDEDDFDGEQDVLSSTSSDSDPVVWADRWSAWAKLRQMLVYWVIIFALQALASGYTNTVGRIITNEQPSQAVTILYQLGSLSYNGSQGGGLFFANLIVGFGRQRITLILLVAVAVVCAIAGFMHNVYALLACQSGLGLLAGVFIFLSLATVMDMFATSRGRLFGVGSIALVLVGGQLAGPWISKRVLSLLGWPWTYWLTIIVAAVLVVYDGIFARETAAFVLFRRYALRVKRSGQGWTPEPQQETKLRQVFGDDLARPVRLMRYNPLLVVLALGIAVLAGMYMFLFSGLQAVFVRVHGLSSGSAALAVAVSAAVGLVVGVVAIVLLNSKRSSRHDAGGFATKARPLYLDEKGHIDTRRPLRAKTESLLVTGLFATAAFSFALYTMALTSSFATTWFLTAFSIVLSTASLLVVGVSVVQYVLDGYSMPRRTTLRDVVAREEVSTPTLLQNEDDDRFTSYSRRTAARLAAAAAGASRFKGGRGGRHGQSQEEKLHAFGDHRSDAGDERAAWLDAGETVTAQRDKRWLDETALAGVTAVVSLPFTICPVLSFISFQAFAKLSFGAFAVIFASVALAVLLALLCVYLYGAKPRARSLSMLDEADADRAHNRRARKREKRALKRQQSLPRTQSMTESQVQAMQNRKGSAPARLAQKLVDALGYKPLSDDGLDMYQRSKGPEQGRTTTRAPVSLMREVETRSTATDAADGRRELWLAKFIANRDKSQKAPETASADVRPAPAIRLNEATEAPQRLSSLKTDTAGNGLKQTMKAFSGVMFGRTTTANNDVQSPDTIARNLPASTSLPANLHSSTNNFASPPTPYHPLSPPPRAQPRASISQHRDPTHPAPVDGFEIVQFQTSPPLPDQHADRPYTPVMTRKSVDMSSTRLNIMARSHSQPLNLYAAAGAAGGSPAGARGERQRQTSGRGI